MSDEPADHLIVLTTVGSREDAGALIRHLLERHLVACGTMLPGVSLYRWEGAVTEEAEVLLVLKTRRDRWQALRTAVAENHPYRVPELLALPVSAGLEAYLNWVSQETRQPEGAE